MKHKTMLSLATVHQQCIADNKSEDNTLQLMQDATGQSLDTCLKYLKFEPQSHNKLFDEINTVLSVLDRLKPVSVLDEQIFRITTKDEDILYIKSNIDIYLTANVIEMLQATTITDIDVIADNYEGDLDFILIKQ